ncbi:hypothetical protein DSO57_1003867 [Entomophthora muscae]|uniref:Uncharacterized protein n=1 Tax=Entomophthora muscae TaxID=34485 RepID=A0ACC2RN95_9FUNG|nr:hypothetical protein DSO57_1003867 [Entomophthora muscae]
MPLPAADMGDTMKKLSDTISSLHIIVTLPLIANIIATAEEKRGIPLSTAQLCVHLKPRHPPVRPSHPKKSSKPKKEANASSGKDETYLVESLAAVRSNVAKKHHLIQKVHPYSTPGKTKGPEPLKSELANYESLAAGD